MDRKEGGDIYGPPSWGGVVVVLAAIAITVVAIVLAVVD